MFCHLLSCRNQNDYGLFSEYEEEEEEEEKKEHNGRYNYRVNYMEKDHLVADVIQGGKSIVFLSNQDQAEQDHHEYSMNPPDLQMNSEDQEHSSSNPTEHFSAHDSPVIPETDQNDNADDDDEDGSEEEEITTEDADSLQESDANQNSSTEAEAIIIDLSKPTNHSPIMDGLEYDHHGM